ncbi:MFS general substrate transporter [Tilletiopsis washingtonensis]|jgi:MFS family permease|uniref:MFS general substrate transporter n=1 Tax=Tilletiopsis washingtonensis TaxID=58919 RepID=A0A316ZA33_9BASI|nr:MFS general substrate transporter [Tilletiopsis washingtonensis]PWN98156.1 MFS general substrate transporter [Tilletiopsis washingtonensis]
MSSPRSEDSHPRDDATVVAHDEDKEMQRTEEKAATAPASPAAAPSVPDGGRTAWLTVLGCFLAFFASFGFVTGYGVFQSYYEGILPSYSSDDISWIGSFQLWAITGMALPSVILSAHVGPHVTLAIGTFLTVFGVMMASISKEYYQLLLSHGICTGLGIGLTFMPIVGLPNQWFSKRRGLAVGLALGGSSVGGVIWPVVFNQMVNHDRISYGWTMRTIGFLQLALMGTAIALIRSNVPRNKAVKLSSFHKPLMMAVKSVGVVLFALGLLLHFFGIYVPYFYAPAYAQSLGASPYTAFWVSAVLNAATFFGRFALGAVSDSLGHGNTLLVSVVVSAALAFAWQGVSSAAGIFVWVVFYGFFSGASVSLQSPAIVPLVPNPKLQLMGPYIAILCSFSSFGSLGGSPIAGRLLRSSAMGKAAPGPEDFHGMMYFTGGILFASCAFYIAARATYERNPLAKA